MVSYGSPPRMRGQGLSRPWARLTHRITPADAGTSLSLSFVPSFVWDHPRGCGDKSPSLRSVLRALGSPPRMRGQAKQPRLACSLTRITPADAGTSGGLECVRWCHADHPRGCGDKWSHWFHGLNTTGSPPRMRGQAAAGRKRQYIPGITPADAGTRDSNQWTRRSAEDHPRGCGDKAMHTRRKPMATGSPPRMRGQAF